MVELFANSGDPDQMPQNVAYDLGLHCLPVTPLGVLSLKWVKGKGYSFSEDNSVRIIFPSFRKVNILEANSFLFL